jgi:hypothetical protein
MTWDARSGSTPSEVTNYSQSGLDCKNSILNTILKSQMSELNMQNGSKRENCPSALIGTKSWGLNLRFRTPASW